ncbi:hypothetical protein HMPREF1546_02455 [Oscillibacter sp. KLE 1745]|nr:hypothetical protein HMPREF1546_02455 [Oscillibacter sp. KLE 1745]
MPLSPVGKPSRSSENIPIPTKMENERLRDFLRSTGRKRGQGQNTQ